MKILISSSAFTFSDYIAAGETQIAHAIIERLAKRGHKLYVFTALNRLNRHIPNIDVYELGGYDFYESKDYFGYRWNYWKYSLLCYMKARKLIKEEGIDIVHHIRPAFEGRFTLCARLGVPFVYGPLVSTWNGLYPEEYGSITHPTNYFSIKNKFIDRLNMSFGRYLWSKTIKDASIILVALENYKRFIPEKYQKKTYVVPFGVDTIIFKPRYRKPEEKRRILFVGKLFKRKGLDYLLRAMPDIFKELSDVELLIVGDGSERAYFEEITKELKISSSVHFCGFVPFDHIIPYFQGCDIFCLPSLGEPYGMVLLQAMSCGKPIVSTNAAGPSCIVEHGKAGYLVPLRDSEALAGALINLLSDKDKQKKMGKYNRKLCVEKYDWERIVDKIELIYQELLSKQPRSFAAG